MEKIDITPYELRDYAIGLGWSLVTEALKDGLFVLDHPKDAYSQLVFPKDAEKADFIEMARMSIGRLADGYKKSITNVIEEIREVNDDVICLRYYSDRKIVNSMSFEEALESIVATRQLLLAAASSVVNPSIFHPKLNRTEPQELIKKARFRHTQEGSFVLKVSCPFEVVADGKQNLFGEQFEKPLSRESLELVNRSSQLVLNAVESATIDQLFQSESAAARPLVSYNFCDALTKLYDEERELPYQLVFNWSLVSQRYFAFPIMPQRLSFPFSMREKIEEVKSYFAPQRRDISAVFPATVETLDGDFDKEERRAGFVVLSLFHENEIIKARANLTADYHEVAVQAYLKPDTFIQLRGDLKRGKRLNTLENITEFKLYV